MTSKNQTAAASNAKSVKSYLTFSDVMENEFHSASTIYRKCKNLMADGAENVVVEKAAFFCGGRYYEMEMVLKRAEKYYLKPLQLFVRDAVTGVECIAEWFVGDRRKLAVEKESRKYTLICTMNRLRNHINSDSI